MAHCVIRTDLMSGTTVPADLVSVRVYDSGLSNTVEVDNGSIVELKGYEDGQREVMKGVLATSASKLEDCVVIASVEVMYDERKRNLDEFVNEAGKICRGYVLRDRNMFSLTEPGFDGSAPSKDAEVKIGSNGKLATGTGFGKCVAVEQAGRYKYYTIQIKKPAAGVGG